MGFFWLFRDKEGAVKKVPKKKRAANPQRSGNIRICGEDRNSYSKTDHDATFMRMKRDYMGNDQLLPGYNIQFGVCDEFIAIYDVKHYASDMDCFKPLMEKFNRLYGTYPEYPVADAGFGSFDNYLFCEEHGMKKYMKFTMFKKETEDKTYRDDPYRAVNFPILSMYAKGMTTSDIESHIRDVYGVEVSDTTVSRITDKILPVAKEWQQRPLEAVYAVVFLDAIHYHVRSEGQVVKKAVYIAIGINLDGRKDVLGMWVGENESAKFWATVLNGLKNRGVEDIFIACTDNLTGFSSAIEAVFPKTEIQNCIIHQLRNSSKYVSYKDLKALMADLKAVYAAVDEPAALDALDAFSERWDRKYPKISQSWRNNWANLSTYFKYPQEVRKLIYTTNTIEGFNRQLRKVTKSKSVFPTDDSLLKMLYLAMMDITKKWTGRRQDWSVIYAQLAIFFGDRIAE